MRCTKKSYSKCPFFTYSYLFNVLHGQEAGILSGIFSANMQQLLYEHKDSQGINQKRQQSYC